MKASEMRTTNTDELAQVSLRMQLATQQTNKTHELRKVRRDIARVRTVLHAMKPQAPAASGSA